MNHLIGPLENIWSRTISNIQTFAAEYALKKKLQLIVVLFEFR